LPSHLSADPERKKRFERKARAISSLSHPYICALYDIGHQEAPDFLVMELLEGGSVKLIQVDGEYIFGQKNQKRNTDSKRYACKST
jgi:serine/threonine protein kinase